MRLEIGHLLSLEIVRLVKRGTLCLLSRICSTQPVFLVLHSSYLIAQI